MGGDRSESRHGRVRDLFDRAGMLHPEDRAAFLSRECGSDVALAEEVAGLLRRNPPTAELPVPPVFERLEDEPIPERIGRYRIGQRLGVGGFGEVFEAFQTEPFERRVALKVMKAGAVTNELLMRFQGERQALALLDHPGIAKILDAGTMARGRLYFAMELVEGVAITEHCDRGRLSIDQRLELFIAVCQAVEHAHRRGIIHRDLKPSNVLVALSDAGPQPKVIDFGVAKAGGHALSRETLVTQRGELVGTPEYMSPEQADLGGLDIDTRTDVYALGVLLYELLCGSLPFDAKRLRSGSFSEALRIIREEEPRRPSLRVRGAAGEGHDIASARGTSARRLERCLTGELDWITLKALEKNRDRRYASAHAFAADVRRFRSHEALQAAPPALGYRLGKFARRHRLALVVAVALFSMVIVSAVQSNRRRVLAEEASAESEAVSHFLSGVLGASNPLEEGRDVQVLELLERAVKTDLEEFAGQPRVRARLMHTIGEVYLRLGRIDEARGMLEPALEIREAELGEDHPQTADTVHLVGLLDKSAGAFESAMTHYERALRIYRAAYGPSHPVVAQTLNNMGVVRREQGRPAEALPFLEEAIALRTRLLGPDDLELAESLANLGALYQTTGELEEARTVTERALRIMEAQLGPDHPRVAGVLSNLGSLLSFLGELEQAVPLLRRALEIQEKTLGPDHPELGATLLNLGMLILQVEGPETVFPMYERVLEIWAGALGPAHPLTLTAGLNLGILHYDSDDHAAAAPLLEATLVAREEFFGMEHLELTEPLFYLGSVRRELGELEVSRTLLERCLAIEQAHGRTGLGLASTFEALMLLHQDLGEAEVARGYEQRMEAALSEQ